MKINVKKIRAEMARKQKTSAAVCAVAGITGAGFAKMLRNGSCRPSTLGRIAAALGVDPEELIL